jgi:hypothetical protein
MHVHGRLKFGLDIVLLKFYRSDYISFKVTPHDESPFQENACRALNL